MDSSRPSTGRAIPPPTPRPAGSRPGPARPDPPRATATTTGGRPGDEPKVVEIEPGDPVGPPVEPPADPAAEPSRGRGSWKDLARRVKDEARKDNLSLVAAGVAFFGLISLAPAMAAALSIYGLVAEPDDVTHHLNELMGTVPEDARPLVDEQLTSAAGASGAGLSLGLVVGIGLALWAASSAMKQLLVALSVVHHRGPGEGFIVLRARALLLTLAGIAFVGVVVVLLAVVPMWVDRAGDHAVPTIAGVARWPLLLVLMMTALAVLYRLAAPGEEPARWRWVSWGAAIATVLWLVVSVAFSVYAANFASYPTTYGSMAAVIVLMLWLYLTAACVLLGAEVNAQLEHRAAAVLPAGPGG